MNPKISVIIPVYKAEAYLHRCVDSILAQTFQDFEILLINDGSPDKSGIICESYKKIDNRVRVFHKENGGVSSARQCGIDNALGEYTIHADPDDWVDPNMLEELYKKAKEEDADMVICDFYEENENKQIYHKQQPSALDYATVQKELFQQLHGSCCNKFIRRTCYNKNNVSFDLSLSFCEDLYFHASLLKHKLSITYLPKAYYHYDQNINENSIVKTYNDHTYKYDYMLYEKFTKLLQNTPAYDYAKAHMGYLLVHRAFYGHIFSSKEFKKRFYVYKNDIMKKQQLQNRVSLFSSCLYYSCLGQYRLMYNLYFILMKILSKK